MLVCNLWGASVAALCALFPRYFRVICADRPPPRDSFRPAGRRHESPGRRPIDRPHKFIIDSCLDTNFNSISFQSLLLDYIPSTFSHSSSPPPPLPFPSPFDPGAFEQASCFRNPSSGPHPVTNIDRLFKSGRAYFFFLIPLQFS